jgi:RsiW-degrading membrane proteinase PrsW (M82 family)
LFVVAMQVVAIGIGLYADRWTRTHVDPLTRASWHIEAGDRFAAEEILWAAMHDRAPTPTLVMIFLANHEAMASSASHPDVDDDDRDPKHALTNAKHDSTITDAEIDRALRAPDVPHDAALLGLFRFEGEEADEIERRAAADPPMPWANHMLALEAKSRGDEPAMIELLLREGTSVPNHESDVDAALWRLEEARDWKTMREKLQDPRVAAAASPWFKANVALRWKEIGTTLKWSIVGSYPAPETGPLVLAIVSAAAWIAFCLRLGRAFERPAFRLPLYLAAFGLGIASIVPTTFLITVEEAALHLVPDGTPGRDLVFYVLGVGLREELSKLLLFAPLLLVLRRRGTKLEVLVCGALVGLGFAVVENLEYFARGDLSAAMARFLTANFLHMAMTALTANALDDLVRSKEDRSFDVSRTFLLVAALHGVYDFFLTSHIVREASYVAMIVFFLLTRWFVIKVIEASREQGRSTPLVAPFVLGIAIVVATSFVYGCAIVGPASAARTMAEGLVGLAIVVVLFVRQLRAMES